MSELPIPSLVLPGLTSTARHDNGVLVVTFDGNADMQTVDPLVAHLARVHEACVQAAAGEVVVDFKSLEFMSSSCIKVFVDWISTILDGPIERRYKVRFVSNRELRWQRRSLQSLRCFASDLVSVDE